MSELDRLHRWEESGGTWRVLGRRTESLTISLCRCDGGEEVDRFSTADPAVVAYVDDRETSEEPRPGLAD
jgi:hypothetical protein